VAGTTPSNERSKEEKWDNKYESLRAKKRAAGLCMKCGEPYNPQHHCPKQVGLHVVEELMELLQQEEQEDKDHDPASNDNEEKVLAVSSYAADGTQGQKTIRLQGLLHSKEILVLIDSGISGTFVIKKLVAELKLQTTPIPQTTVRMADGSTVQCNQAVHDLS
jgi:hypothetical protein